MKRALHVVSSLAASAAVSLGACDDASNGDATSAPGIRFAGLGTCNPSGNEDGDLPDGVDRVVVELSGGSLTEAFRTQLTVDEATAEGELVFAQVPVGTGMTLRAAACSGATTTWAGRTTDIDVAEFEKSFPSVFLTPMDQVTCVGSASTPAAARALSEPRVFAALTTVGDSVFVLGGGDKLNVGSTFTLDGTQTVDRYDATTGEIESVGTLRTPRIGALARPLENGTIRVVGGATTLRIAAAGRPGVFADGAAAPASASEIFDPTLGTSTVEVETQLAAWPALAVLQSTAIIAVGGSRGETISDELVILEGGASATTGTVPGGPRTGATVVPLGGELALVWGGNAGGVAAAVGALVDASLPAGSAASSLTVTGGGDVPYGASGALLASSGSTRRVLIVGGGSISSGGAFESPHLGAGRLQLVTVDVTAKSAVVAPVGLGDVPADALKRAFGVLTVLPDGGVTYLGGFTAFTSVPAICGTGTDCLQSSIVRMSVSGLDATPLADNLTPTLALNGGPLGASIVGVADGSWFITGGIDSITNASLAKDPGLFRYEDLPPDLCAEVAPEP